MRVVETRVKSIITKSKLPDADYVVNPYVGCSFACAYCYASFMGRFVGEPIHSWGEYVYVKVNAVELFEKELGRLKEASRQRSLLLSSVTDAWQGPEKKFRLARGILRMLGAAHYPGRVSILTKSPLVTEDLETIRELNAPDVGVTITTTSDVIGRTLEAHAPPASARLKILEAFNRANVPTYAFVGPLLPHLRFQPERLDRLFQCINDAGTREIYIEHINLSPYIRLRLDAAIQREAPDLAIAYARADEKVCRAELDRMISELTQRYKFRVRLARVLDHRKDRDGNRKQATDQMMKVPISES